MTKKSPWFAILLVVFTFVLVSLACVFPAEVTIEGGLIPSAIDDGYAKLDLKKAGCDCETSKVSGKLKYTDGVNPYKVDITGTIDHTLDQYCVVPEDTNLWATGTYQPGSGTFNIGLFGPDDENYDEVKCAECGSCWRLWLVGGEFDGYQNWVCELENPGAGTSKDHPSDSACAP